MSEKYPRSWHFPWSPGGTRDDFRLKSASHFLGKRLIISEKVDGSNVCLEHNMVYARSHGQPPAHPSFDMLKSVHARVKHNIPQDYQVFGEWMFAKHSIEYDKLPHYLLLFGVKDVKSDLWLSWKDVLLMSMKLGVGIVPVLAVDTFKSIDRLKQLTEFLGKDKSFYGGEREGVVVRLSKEFSSNQFDYSLAKWVRKDHTKTDRHWRNQKLVKNKLA